MNPDLYKQIYERYDVVSILDGIVGEKVEPKKPSLKEITDAMKDNNMGMGEVAEFLSQSEPSLEKVESSRYSENYGKFKSSLKMFWELIKGDDK